MFQTSAKALSCNRFLMALSFHSVSSVKTLSNNTVASFKCSACSQRQGAHNIFFVGGGGGVGGYVEHLAKVASRLDG